MKKDRLGVLRMLTNYEVPDSVLRKVTLVGLDLGGTVKLYFKAKFKTSRRRCMGRITGIGKDDNDKP
mgnify:CR=1 FL=1